MSQLISGTVFYHYTQPKQTYRLVVTGNRVIVKAENHQWDGRAEYDLSDVLFYFTKGTWVKVYRFSDYLKQIEQ